MFTNNDLTDALKSGKIPAIKKAVQDGRQPLLDSFRAGQITGRAASQALSAVIDQQICVFANHFLSEFRDRITLVMTGANGRNDICPRSDLDILILVPDILPDGFADAYSAFALALTDSGFGTIGNCMRTPAECANLSLQDNPTWTSLTDRRRLWGAIPLYCALDRTMDRLLPENGDLLLGAKLDERSKRLGRMADAAYVLHPHIKECAGGLRDFQTVLWIARAAFGCKGMDCFIERGLLSPGEKQRIEQAYDFLLTVRWHLHDMAGKEQDWLQAEVMQPLVARYNDSRPGATPETIESFMKLYFGHTQEIRFFANIISAAVENNPLRRLFPFQTQDRLYDYNSGHIRFSGHNPDPDALLGLFHAAQDLARVPDHTALRAVRAACARDSGRIDPGPETGRRILDILTCGGRAADLLRQMQETGLLQRLIPAFDAADRLMQFDPYHIFTVDEHTFQCIQKLHEIEAGTHAESAPLSYRLISALRNDDPHNHRQALYAALMLHDICKGRDGDHAALGAQLAQELCPLLGLDEERTRLAAWLVEHHLLLARTAAKRDPDDPRTVPQFCAPIPDATHLDLLVLLTTADTMGVGPGRWTPYMEGAATQLYNDARLFMTERALRKTPKADLPADYAAGEIRIAIHNDPKRQVTVVRVVAPDRAELAETLAGTLGLLDANIVDATMETTDENGLPSTAIDCFFIQTSGGLPYQEDFFDRIRAVLEDSLEKNDSAALARKLGVQMKRHTRFSAYPLDVSLLFNNQASARCTVLEVTTRDRPGLLYDLCRTFNELGLTLDRARIAYFGHKAEDTFYLRDAKTGQKIDPERFEAIAKHLADSPGLRIS